MERREAVDRLSTFVGELDQANVRGKVAYRDWVKANDGVMSELFDFEGRDGIPRIGTLVGASFHPELPLVMLNYTPTAHNTLHAYVKGWTDPLRWCRGIIFDRDGNLVALPFKKFFNNGEHPETTLLPDEPFTATEKKDGYLIIAFEYDGRYITTTRGDFTHRAGALAQKILDEISKDWGEAARDFTILHELIDPTTKVLTDYYDYSGLITLGINNRVTLDDLSYRSVAWMCTKLGLQVTEVWDGNNIQDLMALMKDPTVKNKEGFVVRYPDGLRVKFKFQTYIGKMVAGKISYTYLMRRFMSGNLSKMISTLPEEVYDVALKMLGRMMLALSEGKTPKEKWSALYQLLGPEEQSSYYKDICRRFVKFMTPPEAVPLLDAPVGPPSPQSDMLTSWDAPY